MENIQILTVNALPSSARHITPPYHPFTLSSVSYILEPRYPDTGYIWFSNGLIIFEPTGYYWLVYTSGKGTCVNEDHPPQWRTHHWNHGPWSMSFRFPFLLVYTYHLEVSTVYMSHSDHYQARRVTQAWSRFDANQPQHKERLGGSRRRNDRSEFEIGSVARCLFRY